MKKVIIGLTEEVMNNATVAGYEQQSKNVMEFLNNKGIKINKRLETKEYFINSFLPGFPSKAWDKYVGGSTKVVSEDIRIPIQADIVVTGKCHCRCWHCFRINDRRADLSFEEIKKCINELHDLGTASVGITGGEPMLRSDIREVISLIPDDMEGLLYTTGHNFDEDFVDFLEQSNISRVIISLDHYKEELSCSMRNYDNAFFDAINAINLLKDRNLYTAVTVCVTDKLLHEDDLENYFNFVKQLGIDEVRVILPIPQGNIENYDTKSLYLKAMRFVKNKRMLHLEDPSYPNIFNFCEFESASCIGCSAGANYIAIDNTGLVTPCVAVPLSFGNIKEKSIKEIFNDMKKYFPNSAQCCYGRICSKEISNQNVDTSVTPLDVPTSIRIADKCIKRPKRAALFEAFAMASK